MNLNFSFCLLFITCFTISSFAGAQEAHGNHIERRIVGKDTILIENPVGQSNGFKRVAPAVEPKFNGNIRRFLRENQNSFASNSIHGTVKVLFIIEKTGKVTKARVIKSLTPTLNQEALRLVNLMPDWEPALMDGKPIDWTKIIEFNF